MAVTRACEMTQETKDILNEKLRERNHHINVALPEYGMGE